jgi:hypothetical protein
VLYVEPFVDHKSMNGGCSYPFQLGMGNGLTLLFLEIPA